MDGPPPQEEDFTVIPVADRLVHKNWKARVSGYESLINVFKTTASDTDPAFKPYINNSELLKKFATDANAVAQERGVECLVFLVKYAGETAAKTREVVAPALVDKCVGSTRAGTKNQAIELLLQYVEVENGGAGVVNDVLVGLSAKQPKTVAGCVLALKEIVRLFGTQITPPAPILKVLPKIFAHTDKVVRAEGNNLTHVLYQCIGAGIEPWLADLKPVQVKELKEMFESMDAEGRGKGSLKFERMTRAQARAVESQPAEEAGEEENKQIEEEASIDPRAFAEVVDIVPKISPSLLTDLKSSKWKERKEALDDLATLLIASPRIKDAPELAEISKALASRVATDANINCVMAAASCIEGLAKGMMSSFAKLHEAIIPLMLERMKERKANVTDAIGAALDAVFSTTTLSDILPDLDTALKSKNPQVKEGSLKFLYRSLASATSPIQTSQIKPLADTLAILLEDGFEGARNEAALCLGYLMKMVGERPLNAVMEGLADVRKSKVTEAYEKATVKCKLGGTAPPRATASATSTSTRKPTSAKPIATPAPPPDEVDVAIVKKLPTKPAPKPPAAKKSAPTASAPPVVAKKAAPVLSKSSKPSPPSQPGGLDIFKYRHTPEDAEVLATELIPSAIMASFADANWKTRLAALEDMTVWIESEIDSIDAEVVVRALAKKGWTEKNFQVSAKLYSILCILSQRCPSFGRSCAALCIPHLTEKLGDLKLKKPAGDALALFAERTSLQFVLAQAYDPLSKQKAPKALADALGWINTALTEFGIAGVSLRNLIEFLKSTLQNSNAAVRTSATKTLVTVRLFAGVGIKTMLEDLNPQLLVTISSEFEKVDGNSAPEPSRTSADLAAVAVPSSANKNTTADADPLEELFPRVEIDGLLKGSNILADAKSEAWKTKKEALESFQAILDEGSNKRLKPQMGEIGQVLKARVTDTNKAVQSLALDIVSRIATGMGKPFEKHSRLFVLPVSTVLADQKPTTRAAALQTLTAIAAACESVDSMVSGVATALETSNPMQKSGLLNWMVEWFKEHEPTANLDLKSWASPVVSSLDDRNGDVRKGAQAILPTIIRCAGFDFVMQQTNSLKPASRASAVPLIQTAQLAIKEEAPCVQENISVKATNPDISPSAASKNAGEQLPMSSVTAPKTITSKLGGVRRKLPLGSIRPESRSQSPIDVSSKAPSTTKLKATGSVPTTHRPQPSQSSTLALSLPFTDMNLDAKKSRLGKDASRWINEGGPTRKDLAELLQTQMESHASKELIGRLFSRDHNAVNDHIAGLSTMADFFSGAVGSEDTLKSVCIANFDLALKYVSIKAHEPQPNLISKCLEVVEAILGFLRSIDYQMSDNEATCFVPTIVYKLGDAREQVRIRVQQIIRLLPMVYAYSRVFQLLLEHGLKSKVAKTRQGALDEMGGILKKSGMGACDPARAFPIIASMISDKDPAVRKSALSTLSEAYSLVGEKVWAYVGPLSPKDKTQLEERLRRVSGPSSHEKGEPVTLTAAPAGSRLLGGVIRPASPAISNFPRAIRPESPLRPLRSSSPVSSVFRPESPVQISRDTGSVIAVPPSPTNKQLKPKSMLPSRLGRPRTNLPPASLNNASREDHEDPHSKKNDSIFPVMKSASKTDSIQNVMDAPALLDTPTLLEEPGLRSEGLDDITVIISSILSSDATRSVEALKKIQKILAIGPDAGPSSAQYRELAEHTEGLVETITLQMSHVMERPSELVEDDNFRLAKHLIQTLNNFCDHGILAESLTVDNLTSLLEELTLRLLETDDSSVKKVKDLSRFINMIILRLFATGRRMSIFRALFALLLQIVKPFPVAGTLAESKEAKVAELVLKCVWKLARNIPQDLNEAQLDPVELFPAIEHFLQSVPPNEWRARATNKVPCGDMPLRTIKVIIQHVVAHYGDEVYELLSASFDDPSATIVYPYVYRILNSGSRPSSEIPKRQNGTLPERTIRPISPVSSRPLSPQETASSNHSHHHPPPSHRTSPSSSSLNGNGFSAHAEEPDPDAQLLVIIGHISSETTGAMHKEGITELHHFLKAYPHKKPRVEKMLESTGPAFRKYINRALASRAAEDQERDVAVSETLSKLEYNHREVASPGPSWAEPQSPQRSSISKENPDTQERLSRLHDIFQYRSSTLSTGSSQGHSAQSAPRTSSG